MAKIFLITGPTQSRKTTRLTHWCSGRTDVGGLLSPIVFNKRCFQNIRTQEWLAMEAELDEAEVQQVGRYTFSERTFAWANHVLLQTSRLPGIKWLVVDEIGPLELQGKGLNPALEIIFSNLPPHLNLILVIREKICESVLEIYDLKRYGVELFHYPEN
ncbi:nucleoside-triphosphatase [Adhaeribacter terreus]|uniref:Nucleoside-triphosphatase n=1 Tax=Adhaeribacter terreus TaxID=529703 RepID=A0ABW0EIA8_9BACT